MCYQRALANVKEGKTEILFNRFSLVIVGIYPTGAGRFLAADISLVEIIPVADEGVLVEDEAPVEDPGISLLFKFRKELGKQAPFHLLVFFDAGQVVHAIGVFSQIVHLVDGTFPEIHTPKFFLSCYALIEND